MVILLSSLFLGLGLTPLGLTLTANKLFIFVYFFYFSGTRQTVGRLENLERITNEEESKARVCARITDRGLSSKAAENFTLKGLTGSLCRRERSA